jgi:hypothetical protein
LFIVWHIAFILARRPQCIAGSAIETEDILKVLKQWTRQLKRNAGRFALITAVIQLI